jgi:hypothetical protein
MEMNMCFQFTRFNGFKLLSLLSLFFVSFVSPCWAKDTLLYNIQGLSIEQDKLERFHAIQFNERVIKLYRDGEPLPDITKQQQFTMIDGKKATVMPGLIDAHGHVLNYGLSLMQADLTQTRSEQQAVAVLKQYAESQTSLTWLQGRGWNQELWSNKQFPTAKSLDVIFQDKPVWLRRVDGHAGWANNQAMKLAGITKETPTPSGGEIVKDAQGEPTGIFIDNAMALIDNAIPPLTINEEKQVLLKALSALAQLGLTSVHDAGVRANTITAYKQLAREHQLPIRVYAMLDVTDPNWLNYLKQGPYQSFDGFFVLKSVKISADGALGSRGAALLNDYSDKPHHRGLLLHSPDQLKHYVLTAMRYGFQVNTHAIGDRANQLVLDTYEEAIKETKSRALRHRIEHAQVVMLTDLPRFSQIGIIASMQATHATSDKVMAEKRLGKARLAGAYAWRRFLQSGAVIANGSDFPVEPPNPFYGLHAAITRQDRQNQPLGGWLPEQRMTVEQALRSFTYHAAYAAHQERKIGSLTEGKQADLILVDHNILTQPVETIWQNKVLSVWVKGQQLQF